MCFYKTGSGSSEITASGIVQYFVRRTEALAMVPCGAQKPLITVL